jgi:hypothetical protein
MTAANRATDPAHAIVPLSFAIHLIFPHTVFAGVSNTHFPAPLDCGSAENKTKPSPANPFWGPSVSPQNGTVAKISYLTIVRL